MKIMEFLRKIKRKIYRVSLEKPDLTNEKIHVYLSNGRIPWSSGYREYKTQSISNLLDSSTELDYFKSKMLPTGFGLGIDERIVEYPWIFSKLSNNQTNILDAGSTFNFEFIVNHSSIKKKNLTIYTFFPEQDCFFKNRINYVFGDLRSMFFSDNYFDEIVCQSTIEHIDMDNSIYGYQTEDKVKGKSYEYMKALHEIVRVLKPGGVLLLTFPFGKYEFHNFFQQFDDEMLGRVVNYLSPLGAIDTEFFKYEKNGWQFSTQSALANSESYNPHTGKGKGDDGAAHCRGIACIHYVKK